MADETKLIGNLDAKIWAEEFVKTVKEHSNIPTDEATMLGWFANAIMTGFDVSARREQQKHNCWWCKLMRWLVD